ncbi:MAG: T9SS type A sorting domain-containing protein [Parafilimonas sp.]
MKTFLLILTLVISTLLNAQSSVNNKSVIAQPGTLDSSFGTNGVSLNNNNGSCNAIALQKSGKIIYCGVGVINNTLGLKLARYNVNGLIDSSFGVNGYVVLNYAIYGSGEFFCLTVLDDDKIIAAGDINNNVALAKFTADGKLDSSFGEDGIAQKDFDLFQSAWGIQTQADGKIVIAGQSAPDVYNTSGLVVRYLADGTLDKSFGNGGEIILPEALRLFSVVLQKDGKIVPGGFTNIGDNKFYVGRLNEDGSYDKSFGGSGYVYTRFSKNHRDQLRSLALQTDSKILGAGISNIYGGNQDMGVARYNTDGSLDSSFGTNGLQSIAVAKNAAEATAVLLQNDGKIILSGDVVSDTPSSGDALLVRLNTNGSIDSTFGVNGVAITDLSNGGSDYESGAVLQTDGKIITVGSSYLNNMNYDNIVRYNNDGLIQKQQIIAKIRRWLQHRNGIEWNNINGASNYVVQRSYDGIHWSTVHSQQTTASSQQLTANSYYNDPAPLNGSNYYRLQTTSISGVVNYSNVIAVNADEDAIKISPNPATNSLHIEGLPLNQKIKLTVVDFTGNTKLQAIANAASYNLNIASLTTGNYLLKIEMNNEMVTKKFVKQ